MAQSLAHDDPRVGQPYPKQWWCRYVNVPGGVHDPHVRGAQARLKQNRFTRRWYVFVHLDSGNRWNEPGYGWGRWVPLSDMPAVR